METERFEIEDVTFGENVVPVIMRTSDGAAIMIGLVNALMDISKNNPQVFAEVVNLIGALTKLPHVKVARA